MLYCTDNYRTDEQLAEMQLSDPEEAHERCQNPGRSRPVKSLNGRADLFGNRRRHLRQTSKRNGSTQLRSGFPCPQFSSPSCADRG